MPTSSSQSTCFISSTWGLSITTQNQYMCTPMTCIRPMNGADLTFFSSRSSSLLSSAFLSRRMTLITQHRKHSRISRLDPCMLVDPWSISPEKLDVLAGQLFAVSLVPYLVFLSFLSKKETNTPKQAIWGFQFLLVFVFATIPAGIYAKLHYHDILANIDWLHGGAESLLTITNLLIAIGFRNAVVAPPASTAVNIEPQVPVSTKLKTPAFLPLVAAGLWASSAAVAFIHPEPSNALSFPTWVIHVSSLVEWLVAMGLVWQYAETTGNSRWKGLTWGMLPLHSSGICACTFHLFYNAPSLNLLVTLQAALTCIGNATMAFAAYRIYQQSSSPQSSAFAKLESVVSPMATMTTKTTAQGDARFLPSSQTKLFGFEDLGRILQEDSNTRFIGKLFVISAIGSAVVKWGSLTVDGIFDPDPRVALAIIVLPTMLNVMKWAIRSGQPGSNFGEMF